MNKYQETIYNLVHLNKARGEVFIDHKQLQQDIDVLWELHNKYDELTKTPTLEEVKKEWEEEGYRMYINAREFTMFDNANIISLYKDDILIFNIYVDERMYTCRIIEIPLEIHQLLTKTFRALGWEV